jgi:hypothetical protein
VEMSGTALSQSTRTLSHGAALAVACMHALACAPAARPAQPPRAPAPPSAPAACVEADGEAPVEVRLISLAPSPYTNRHDALRAGFGIFLSLRQIADTHRLPLRISYYDGSEFVDDAAAIGAVLQGARVLVIGGSTWSQGPTYHVRRFFEKAGAQPLSGVSATAWATAGGAHTGGEEVVATTLRSLMGMGAQTFTLGQKYMVFTTDERLDPPTPGAFGLLDLWYMNQFARTIAVVALAGNDPRKAGALSRQLGVTPYYFMNGFPPDQATLATYRALQERLNAAADPQSDAYRELRSLLSPRP